MADREEIRNDWTWSAAWERAASHFPSLREGRELEGSMFIDDVSSGMVPFRLRGRDAEKFKIEISGSADDRERVIALLSSLSSHEYYDLGELLADAIHTTAQSLAWRGRAMFQLGRAEQDQSVYLLNRIASKRLFNCIGCWVQLVPEQDREFWNNRAIIVLAKNDVWTVDMPKELGGFRGYRRCLRRLRRFQQMGPTFWRESLGRGSTAPLQFNFQEYRRNVELYECKTTKTWGWNRRDYSGRHWTEFMQFHRTITFHWAQAVLREHILAEFNKLLDRLKIEAKIEVSGIPLSSEILRIRAAMSEGSISFGKAFEAVSVV